ncbi:MAG: tetratricopeptide repeat protein [Sedimentisphaerales bacterium]|nr:tetratricopeptide repeat protein [Sedimentisphaerales bacterium]
MDIAQNDTNQEHDSTQHYEILQELGDCYCSIGDYDRARQYYENAAVLGPDEAAPYVGLGVVALQNNQLEDARAAFQVACRLDANCAKAYAGLGMAAQQKNDYQLAFDMYLKSLELDSENMIGLLGLFQTSCQMGSFGQVTHYLELYLNMHPGDTSVMYPLAALYMRDGKIEASQNILRDILALAPDNEDAANLLEEIEHNLAQTQRI